ncbi:MAG TPA: putative LPS assembly protein LptD [Longimicrobiaceae bacterium]
MRALLAAAAISTVWVTGSAAQVRPDTLPPQDTVVVPAPDTVPVDLPDTTAVQVTLPDSLDAEAPDTLSTDSTGARVAPPDPEGDAIIQELRELRGYVATEYLGERAVYESEEEVLRLMGKAQVEREGNRLTADTIVYRGLDDLVEAYGEPRVVGESQELTGRILYYDLVTRRATAFGARTEVQQSANWIVTGDVTVETGEDTRIYATSGHFTTCDLAIPHYHFEADEIKIVRDKYLVGRPARLYFGRVPVAVLPFFVQSLEQGRRSGLIAPRFSLTDIVRNSGHTREISDLGWYWAINDYLGAQVTGRWRSGAYTALTGNLDFRWRRQFLQGNFAFTRYWRQNGRREFGLNGNGSWRPDERTNLSASASYSSSSEFIRESTIDPLEATQDLNSAFNLSRRFDWGVVALGADARQSMADGGLTYTFPRFSISPNPITLFPSSSPDLARWYNNATINWNFDAIKRGSTGEGSFTSGAQDQSQTQVDGGLSLTLGRLSISTSGNLDLSEREEVTGFRFGNDVITGCPLPDFVGPPQAFCEVRPGGRSDQASWSASINYQQELIGQTTLTPTLGVSQQILRDSLTNFEYLAAPMRVNFGASLATALFGFYGGFGPFEAMRHRITPTISYTYSPAVQQNAAQDSAFGVIESRTRSQITLNLNQTFEAKLRPSERRERADTAAARADSLAAGDSLTAGDTLTARATREAEPQQPEKVTLLSITTSALTYDFTRARETGNGFTNTSISNNITSDYLGGLSVQITHDLFDQSEINPNDPEQRGRLGRFAPRLSRLSTGFHLGPTSPIFRWLGILRRGGDRTAPTDGNIPGEEEPGPTDRAGATTATGNQQSLGSGQWRATIDYSFTRPSRTYDPQNLRRDEATQTINLSASLPLTPNWAADWRTQYSITDNEFAGHSLNFSRSLHRWQANFSFFQTATGNTGFQFYVELVDNRDLHFDYRERNLGIDRR